MTSRKAKLTELNKDLKQSFPQKPQPIKTMEANVPRGERAEFLKLSITMSSQMLSALKMLGLKMKESGEKDGDTSSLIRLAVAEFLNKPRA